MERILLVEDDAQITASLSAFLQSEGFSVEMATGETQARQLVEQTAPGLLLVDVQLAEGSGFGVCAYARSRGLPVIFLTASGDESSVVLGLDMGADDYIAKPFRPRELVSRIRSVLRRYGKEKTLVPLGGVMVDTEKGRVTRDGRDVYLSALEYRLLLVFLSHRGKVLSRSQLLEEIWDAAGDFVNDNTLTVYIKRLREKIETDPQTHRSSGRCVASATWWTHEHLEEHGGAADGPVAAAGHGGVLRGGGPAVSHLRPADAGAGGGLRGHLVRLHPAALPGTGAHEPGH